MATHEVQQILPNTKLNNGIIFLKNDRYKDRAATFSHHSKRMDYLFECFSHACTHELREPMRSVASLIQLLSHQNQGLDKESLNHLHYIRQSIDRMDILIRDIAYYLSIVEKMNHARVTVDTNEIFDSIKERFSNLILENGAQFSIAALPAISGVRKHIGSDCRNDRKVPCAKKSCTYLVGESPTMEGEASPTI